MSSIVWEIMSMCLVALTLYGKDDLRLLLSDADFHSLIANEPNLFITEKNLAGGEDRYFLGVKIKLMKSKSAPQLVRVVV